MDLRQIQGLISVQMEKIADYTITSPMDGVVLRRDGEIGEIAEAGQMLFRVGVPKPLQVVAEVNEEDIPRVASARQCCCAPMHFRPAARGQVSEITPMGDVAAKTYPHQNRAARRHAAQARHERRGQRGHAREAGRAARSGRRGAGQRVFVDRWRRGRAGARSRSASAARARSRSCPG